MIQKRIIFFVLLFTTSISSAQLKLPALVSDGMVLQRDQPVKIWGWNLSGKEIIVSFNGKTYIDHPNNDNKWLITLDAMPAGGPYGIQTSTADLKDFPHYAEKYSYSRDTTNLNTTLERDNSFKIHYQPSTLFNAMIYPLIPYTIKGITWYQGESNAGKSAEYATLLPALIRLPSAMSGVAI